MKLKTVFTTTAVLATAFLVGSVVVAGEHHSGRGFKQSSEFMGGHGGRHGPEMLFGGRFMQQLDLTPEQHDAVKDVMQSAKPAMHEAHEARRDIHKRLMEITPDNPSYAAVVDEVAQEAAETASRTTRLAAQLQADIWALLTDAQKAEAVELRSEMQQRMAEHRAKRLERRQSEAEAE